MAKSLRTLALATVSALAMGGVAQAGGFINSSQSSVFNGMAYAGFAAPGSTSAATMFMNPATLTHFNRIVVDTNYTFGLPNTQITGSWNLPVVPGSNRSGDIGKDYFVPATYIVVPITDRLVGGISLNAPYGNSTKSDVGWIGRPLGVTSKMRTITITPSLAYKVNNWLSVGAGLQLQYMSARQVSALAPPLTPFTGGAGIVKADGWGVGFTLGATITPVQGTQIGIGWRSLIDQEVEGTTQFGPFVSNNSKGKLNLPNRVNLSLRQTFNPQFDLLASIEWQNWGRIGHARLNNPANAALENLPFGYSDGWMFSVGGEYKFTQQLTLRAGAAYEISPVRDNVRRVVLPDNDRIWLSAGLSYHLNERFTINASYSHLFIKEANIVQTTGPLVFTGKSKAHADLISFGLTSRWGDAPKKEDVLVRKY